MTELEPDVIKQGNKKIAKFLNVRYTLDLDYFNDWNLLMVAVAKVADRTYYDIEYPIKLRHSYNHVCGNLFLASKQQTFCDVVTFIDLYKQKENVH